ncbi:MAG: hypothetical protein CL760_02210 [Chloroflexi bacterium]|nr:hypothetical protein [Chloroflexota bacterium]MQG05737.1 class I SAM-dependent methyltransferase [SAR202 cluster bacterium]|tara:strand:- start:2207 stop:3112 length:906 start_codon:yes stop_codon:yes gene_type:complete
MIENYSFSYPTWGKLTSEKYHSIAKELKQLGSTISSETQADPAGRLQNFTLKLWENPYIYYQIEKYCKKTLKSQLKILDIGSGLSPLPAYLQKKGHQVTAVDDNSWKLWKNESWIKKIYNTNVEYIIIKDISSLKQFEKNSFDLIISCSVIEHFDDQTFNQFIPTIYKILKPEGCIVLTFDLNIPIFQKNRDSLESIYPEKALNIIEMLLKDDPSSLLDVYKKKLNSLIWQIKYHYPLFIFSKILSNFIYLFFKNFDRGNLQRKLLSRFNKSGPIFNTYSRKYLGEVTTSIGISLLNTPKK